MPTSDELMRLARACANRITPPRKSRQFPSFSEVEEQCEEEYEELLGVPLTREGTIAAGAHCCCYHIPA